MALAGAPISGVLEIEVLWCNRGAGRSCVGRGCSGDGKEITWRRGGSHPCRFVDTDTIILFFGRNVFGVLNTKFGTCK